METLLQPIPPTTFVVHYIPQMLVFWLFLFLLAYVARSNNEDLRNERGLLVIVVILVGVSNLSDICSFVAPAIFSEQSVTVVQKIVYSWYDVIETTLELLFCWLVFTNKRIEEYVSASWSTFFLGVIFLMIVVWIALNTAFSPFGLYADEYAAFAGIVKILAGLAAIWVIWISLKRRENEVRVQLQPRGLFRSFWQQPLSWIIVGVVAYHLGTLMLFFFMRYPMSGFSATIHEQKNLYMFLHGFSSLTKYSFFVVAGFIEWKIISETI